MTTRTSRTARAVLATALLVVAALAACGGGDDADAPAPAAASAPAATSAPAAASSSAPAATSAPAASATADAATTADVATTATEPPATRTAYPVTVESCGRKLTFEKAPERILGDQEQDVVPLYDLGLEDRIVAIFSHKASDIEFMGVDPVVAAAIRTHEELSPAGTAYPVFEKVLAARADFILEAYPGDATGGDPKNQKQLDTSGIPVYTQSATCEGATPSIESTFADLRNLGIIFDVQDRAEAVIAAQRALIDETIAAVAGREPVRAFLIDSFGEKGVVYTNTSTFVRDQIEKAGGIPVPEPGADIYSTSLEALAASAFDIVLVTHYADPEIVKAVGTDEERAEKVFAAAPDAPGSKARRWAAVPYPSGPSTALILRKLAEAMHPDAFAG